MFFITSRAKTYNTILRLPLLSQWSHIVTKMGWFFANMILIYKKLHHWIFRPNILPPFISTCTWRMTKEPFFASHDVDITFFRLSDWHFCCFLSTLQRRKVVSTPLEWGQAWLERALLVKAPVLLSECKLELGEHSLELLYCCHCRQAASNVLTHLYQPVTGRRPASPLLPFRNCYFRPRRLWPRLLPPFFVWSRTQNKGGISVLLNLVLPPHNSTCIYTCAVLRISQSMQLFLHSVASISLNDFVKYPSLEHLDFLMIEMSISVFD